MSERMGTRAKAIKEPLMGSAVSQRQLGTRYSPARYSVRCLHADAGSAISERALCCWARSPAVLARKGYAFRTSARAASCTEGGEAAAGVAAAPAGVPLGLPAAVAAPAAAAAAATAEDADVSREGSVLLPKVTPGAAPAGGCGTNSSAAAAMRRHMARCCGGRVAMPSSSSGACAKDKTGHPNAQVAGLQRNVQHDACMIGRGESS